jgi:hypothetical protein
MSVLDADALAPLHRGVLATADAEPERHA